MKQFELKFYREWYDALSELSSDNRAKAALSLLEYVYEGKIPDDQFIRIVTTLMRNRIDREKAAVERKSPMVAPLGQPSEVNSISIINKKDSEDQDVSAHNAEPESDDAQESAEANEKADDPSMMENADKSSEKAEAAVSGDENRVGSEPAVEGTVELITPEMAAEKGISPDNADKINSILLQHYKTDNTALLELCSREKVDPASVAFHARRIMMKWILRGWHGRPLPPRDKRSDLLSLDKAAVEASKNKR